MRSRGGEPMSDEIIKTDDRELERAGGACNHRKCRGSEEGCRAYSEETLRISPADEERARQLVAEGWWSTSAKSRTIARWKEPLPTIEDLFRPEALATFHGQRLAHFCRQHLMYHQYGAYVHNHAADEHHEHATLSPSLFKAFKAAGGDCAR